MCNVRKCSIIVLIVAIIYILLTSYLLVTHEGLFFLSETIGGGAMNTRRTSTNIAKMHKTTIEPVIHNNDINAVSDLSEPDIAKKHTRNDMKQESAIECYGRNPFRPHVGSLWKGPEVCTVHQLHYVKGKLILKQSKCSYYVNLSCYIYLLHSL